MKNLERSEFDEQWKGAFEGAEVPPASSVWSNLDRELTLAEGSEIKKRMIFYQRLAAACLMFALLAGSFGVYHWKQSDKQVAQLKAANDSNDQSRISTNLKEKVGATNNSKSSIENKGNAKNEERIHRTDGNLQRSRESDGNSLGNKELIISNEERTLTNSSMGEKQNKSSGQWYAANLRVPDLMLLPIGAIHGEPTFVEIRRRLPFIPSAFMDKSKKENFNHEKLWASVVAAAGAYSDHNGGSPYSMTNAQSSSSSSAPTGNSYTVGMLGGVRIARRWVLQSGVQYMNQSAGYTSNVSATSLYDLANIAKTPSASLNTS
ncbi:MAG: hypothetical protein HY015_02345, partial [Bacteroidetes bacterium]|nr:hypothetical protein [Bacteroidota bacterium]